MKITKRIITVLIALVMVLSPLAQPMTVKAATSVTINAMDTHKDILVSPSLGWSRTGLYLRAAPNDATSSENWDVEYVSTSTDCVKLTRHGATESVAVSGQAILVKLNQTDYYFKVEPWTVGGGHTPLLDGDILTLNGTFQHIDSGDTITINNVTIELKGDDMIVSPSFYTMYESGSLSSHEAGMNGSKGFYFRLPENAAAYNNWDIEYLPKRPENISFIRDNAVIPVGITNRGALVKFSEIDYYLKLEWNIGDYSETVTTSDIIVIEGDFVNYNNNEGIRFEKTYIYYDGTNWVTSTTLPSSSTVVASGSLSAHSSGITSDGVWASMESNSAANGTYAPVANSNFTVIREGVTSAVSEDVSLGVGSIVKSDAGYLIAAPGIMNIVQNGDILVLEGKFYNSETGKYLYIEKTYIYYVNGQVMFSTSAPATADLGMMETHTAASTTSGIYVNMPPVANNKTDNAPYNDSWAVDYSPVSSGVIKLVRDNTTVDVGVPGVRTLVKFSGKEGYLELTGGALGDYSGTITENDMLIVEGTFACHQAPGTITVDKTYIYHDGTGWVCSSEPLYHVKSFDNHSGGLAGTGIHAYSTANYAAYNTDWSLEYKQTSADNVKLIRDGVQTSVGIPGNAFIIKFGENDYFLKVENWNLSGVSPLQEGDTLIIEGIFTNDACDIYVEKSYVEIINGVAQFYTVDAGHIEENANNNSWTGSGGLYFTMAENEAPYDDWALRYTPMTTSDIKLFRDGTVTNIANTGAETIVKYTETEYYLEFWPISGDLKPIQAGDIIIVHGVFNNAANRAKIHIAPTYIEFNADNTVTCYDECPHRYNDGEVTTAPGCTATGIKTYTCLICSHTYTEDVAANGHSYTSSVTAPTCEAQGYTTHTCSACGNSYVDSYVEATGHSHTGEVTNVNGVPTLTYTCSGCDDSYAIELKFSGANIALENTLIVGFLTNSDIAGTDGFTDIRAEFTYGNRVDENKLPAIYLADAAQTNGLYEFPCKYITPSQIGDTITATLYGTYGDTEYSYTMTYSVSEYCYNQLAGTDEELNALLVNLLYYCDYARAYTTYKADEDPVTKDLTAEQQALVMADREYTSVMNAKYATVDAPQATWKGASLILYHATRMQFSFTVNEGVDVSGLTVKVMVGSEERTGTISVNENDPSLYHVTVDDLSAREMSATVLVTLYSGDTAISNTASYSIESYVKAKQNDSNAKLADLVKAMMRYGDAAYAYFN